MLSIRLAPAVAERLARFLERQHAAERSDHWKRYGAMNRVRVEGDRALVSAGAGFDSEYELNFRTPTLRETVGRIVRAAAGRDDLVRYRTAYHRLWCAAPRRCASPHAIVAEHYMRL